MKTKFNHIYFSQDDSQVFNGKAVWDCKNNKTNDDLAQLCFYKPWQKYIVRFNPNAVFDEGCLKDIITFLESLKK